jgi:hypothetical protein
MLSVRPPVQLCLVGPGSSYGFTEMSGGGSPGGLTTFAGPPANRKHSRAMNDDALINLATTGGADMPRGAG